MSHDPRTGEAQGITAESGQGVESAWFDDGRTAPKPLANNELRACWCYECLNAPEHGLNNPTVRMMILCPACGNKRCPRASDHRFACTDSNAAGQFGSHYGERPWSELAIDRWRVPHSGAAGQSVVDIATKHRLAYWDSVEATHQAKDPVATFDEAFAGTTWPADDYSWRRIWIIVQPGEGVIVHVDPSVAARDLDIYESNEGERGKLIGPFVLESSTGGESHMPVDSPKLARRCESSGVDPAASADRAGAAGAPVGPHGLETVHHEEARPASTPRFSSDHRRERALVSRTWIVTRSSSNRYMGAYEWVRNAKSAAHFITREAAEKAAETACLQNGGVHVEPYAYLADSDSSGEPEAVPPPGDAALNNAYNDGWDDALKSVRKAIDERFSSPSSSNGESK